MKVLIELNNKKNRRLQDIRKPRCSKLKIKNCLSSKCKFFVQNAVMGFVGEILKTLFTLHLKVAENYQNFSHFQTLVKYLPMLLI